MGIVEDLVKRFEQMKLERLAFDREWADIARYVSPAAPDFMLDPSSRRKELGYVGLEATRNVKTYVYDNLGMWAVDRLASGMESLITPQSEKYQGLALDDPLAPEASHEEKEYFDRLRDYIFAIRYDARSGFARANTLCMRQTVALGTSVMFNTENFTGSPISYRHIPLIECYLDQDYQGTIDTVFRHWYPTARQLVQQFGGKVSAKTKELADDPNRAHQTVECIHAVFPRTEGGRRGGSVRNSPWESHYIEVANKHELNNSGFFWFPFTVYRWLPDEIRPYGIAPTMLAIAEIKGAQQIRKTMLRAAQQLVDPPTASADDGMFNAPNLNPGKNNPGMLSESGQFKIKPIITAQSPDFARELLQDSRQQVGQMMHVELFQILAQNPGMTATEALIRNNEKGQLLGPAGNSLQGAISHLTESEILILEQFGFFDVDNDALPFPETLNNKSFGARMTSPLDKLRRANEGLGILQTFEAAGALAAIDPSVSDNLDSDEAIRLISEINGAPARILRPESERDELRDSRQQLEQLQQNISLAGEAGDAAQTVIPALQQVQQAAAQ